MKVSCIILFSLVLISCVVVDAERRIPFLGGILGITRCPPRTYPSQNLPEQFDAREQWPDCISPIRDQQSCGSCWAFASTSVLTDRFCIASNNTIKRLLSPQDMLNCGEICKNEVLETGCNQGCDGGYLDTSWIYFAQNGTRGDSCLSYKGEEKTCAAKCDDGTPYTNETNFRSDTCYQLTDVNSMMVEIYKYGPLESGYNVYEDFYDYDGGVYIYDGTSDPVGGHAIRIIGWGVDDDVPYWLVANSWGTGWGPYDGYFKIRRGTDECDIESNAIAGQPITTGIADYEDYPDSAPLVGPSLLALAIAFVAL